MGVTCRGQDLEDVIVHRNKRHIARAAAKVVDEDIDEDIAIDALPEAIGNGRSAGPVDETEHIEACEEAGVHGGRAGAAWH